MFALTISAILRIGYIEAVLHVGNAILPTKANNKEMRLFLPDMNTHNDIRCLWRSGLLQTIRSLMTSRNRSTA